MDREDFDNLSRDLLGRPLTAAEFQALLHASTTLRLGPGSLVATMLILFQSLKTEIAEAMADRIRRAESRAGACRQARIRGWIMGAILALSCGATGYVAAHLRSLGDDRRALQWALSAEGQSARRMAENGVLKPLQDCSVPGWYRQGEYCFPAPDPQTGMISAFRIGPAR